ncbi:uncharacterized protein TM35_000111730 [Trypanosoma theileri]|uniref:Uncharacterized protein n=1 Tax=Trypanosoma theileri TaxID=67003 RepID=A0A1X0NZK1_9TRYP|nr:uncharacterized protein TM35_000111730 [Trypanosoma theileri]ORC89639.1 hypothetical protein TM35_000111730 [Trypanosoma theileri]
MFTFSMRRQGVVAVGSWTSPASAVSLLRGPFHHYHLNNSGVFSLMILAPQCWARRYRASQATLTSSSRNSTGTRHHGNAGNASSSHTSVTSVSAGNGNSNSNGVSGGNHSSVAHTSGGNVGTGSTTTHSHSSGGNGNNNNNNNNNSGGNGNGGSSHNSSSGGGGGVSMAQAAKKKKNTRKVLKRTTVLKKKKRIKKVLSSTKVSSPSGATTLSRTTTAASTGTGSTNVSSATTSSTNSTTTKTTSSHRLRRKTITKKPTPKFRICVLNSSYEGADSVTADVDNYHCSPAHWVKDKKQFAFTEVSVKKNDSYRQIRELVTSNKFDVFFNLCDGGRDEKRAGVDVVEALEEHNAAFTGTDSHSFEPSKIDMKLLVGAAGVNTPNFVLLESAEGLAKKCRHLRFPVIVKHLSGYASVGIHKDNRCDTLEELKTKVPKFLKEFNHALIEEFIRGREGTVLTCADSGSQFGVKVFKPLMFKFLQGDDDFAYFEKKWSMECNDEAYDFLPHNDPAYPQVVDMARNAFKHIMNGVGYGRVDFRIDPKGDVYFLEINPNCGMWYSEKDGGDFADVMVQGDKSWNHDRFIRNAVLRAVREQVARRPWYFISHDSKGNFSTRASKTVRAGKGLFCDAAHPVPVIAQALYKLGEEDPTVGCVIMRGDRLHQAVAIRHSCEPNMQFMQGRTLTLVAKRKINVGEELTVDYATLCDENMPAFACSCGTSNCRSVIFPAPPTPRTLEGKNVRQMMREKKKAWYKEKEDREAERMLKKRASKGKNNSNNSGNNSNGGSGAGTGSGNNSSSSGNSTNSNNNNNNVSSYSSSSSSASSSGANGSMTSGVSARGNNAQTNNNVNNNTGSGEGATKGVSGRR